MAWTLNVDGLERLQELEDTGKNVRRAASRALNTTATRERTRAARLIREQVNFPASYLQPGGGRLIVSKKASPSNLESVITGRARATSLSRFLTTAPSFSRRGRGRSLGVQVKPGSVRYLRRAFPIRLRRGASLTDTRFNVGVAIRLRKGERLENKKSFVRLGGNLYLLYGPSVQQLLFDNAGRGVSRNIERHAPSEMELEFLRLLRL